MKATGIVRYTDELGRVVIPKEMRNTLDIPKGTTLEILCDGDMIVLRKYKPGCTFCGRTDGELIEVSGVRMCRECANNMAVLYRRAEAEKRI